MSAVLESAPGPARQGEEPNGGNADQRGGAREADPESAQPGNGMVQLEVADNAADPSGAGPSSQSEPARVYITGWRLYVVSFSCVDSLFRNG